MRREKSDIAEAIDKFRENYKWYRELINSGLTALLVLLILLLFILAGMRAAMTDRVDKLESRIKVLEAQNEEGTQR